jgi:serine phosphatase RsbU (regulator of sigma subunit)
VTNNTENTAPDLLRNYFTSEKVRKLFPSEVLVRQGDKSHSAFFLDEGEIIVYAETSYGETILATHRAPRLIGEIGALAGLPRTASMRASGDVVLFEIARERLLELGLKYPNILLSAVQQLGRQLGGVNEALALYSNALSALETRTFDASILKDLDNPSPSLAAFSEAFKRLANKISVKRRQDDDMAAAALIQQSFLPKIDALNLFGDRLQVAGAIRPTREVGGDFYDIFSISDDRVAIVMGDVCGKGTPASLFTAIVVTLIRTICREHPDPATAISRVNKALCADNESMMFATVFYGVLNISTRVLEYVNCGHVSPVILSPQETPRRLTPTAIPLAIDDGVMIKAGSTTLTEGDTLILITDGVTESMNVAQREYGEGRFSNLLNEINRLSPKDMMASIFDDVDAFSEGAEQSDDIGCLVVRFD